MIGERFGNLVVTGTAKSLGNGKRYKCLCDCGNTIETQGTNLRGGITKSCGCLRLKLRNSYGLDAQKIIQMYVEEKMDSVSIGAAFGIRGKNVLDLLREHAVPIRPKGESFRLKAIGNIVERGEYLAIRLGDDHHGKLYHRYLMEQHIGRPIAPDEVVHHINGIKRDNRIENLQIMKIDEHTQWHRAQRSSNHGR